MGFQFLIQSTVKPELSDILDAKNLPEELYTIKTSSFKATMKETDRGYVVLKGSQGKKHLSKSCTETYRNVRKKLIETEIMVERGDRLVFVEDTLFNSPSAASNMILGRNSNGNTEWVNSKGQTFREVQEITNASNF